MHTIYVSKDTGNPSTFPTVTAALESIPTNNSIPTTISIAPGIYHEKITINKPFLTLVGGGESALDTLLSYDDYAYSIMEDGTKRGTFRSYSVFIDTHDITLKNLTIENASGDSKTHGQAIALYADGDRLVIDSCRILGHQDTLFTGPLPPKEVEPGGFTGPKQFAPRVNGRQYYKNCYLCGDVDFIFGSATAFFENCIIESLYRSHDDEIQGYITAASTPEGQEYGYVFSKCQIVSKNCPKASVYLGRPWREFAKTIFMECSLGDHIHPAGFHDWGKTAARDTILYGEYKNYPEDNLQSSNELSKAHESISCSNGLSKSHESLHCSNGLSKSHELLHCSNGMCTPFPHRADFVYELDAVQASHFSKELVLRGSDDWNP